MAKKATEKHRCSRNLSTSCENSEVPFVTARVSGQVMEEGDNACDPPVDGVTRCGWVGDDPHDNQDRHEYAEKPL
jgi:hypothetical protein